MGDRRPCRVAHERECMVESRRHDPRGAARCITAREHVHVGLEGLCISAAAGDQRVQRPYVWRIGRTAGWVRLAYTGDRFDAYRSADGVSWTSVGSDTIPMGDTVYVGLAVTSHNSSSTTTAVIDRVKITGSTSSNTSVGSTSTSISA